MSLPTGRYINEENSPDYRHHRAGWPISCRITLGKRYEVHSIIRQSSTFNTSRIYHLYQDSRINGVPLFLHYWDRSDSTNLAKFLYRLEPDEIYHLATQSPVRVSFDISEYRTDVKAIGTVRFSEAIREAKLPTKFYQASYVIANTLSARVFN